MVLCDPGANGVVFTSDAVVVLREVVIRGEDFVAGEADFSGGGIVESIGKTRTRPHNHERSKSNEDDRHESANKI